MATSRFKYQGPIDTGVTLSGEGREREIILLRGGAYDLPAKNAYVASLIAQGYLVPEAPAPKTNKGAA
uniref:Uncharacterized protein n=1 Tax=Candidatus Kentrum sp. LPFa TaxID=2126335 RepID=A0A450WK92_9GAMM|nr:MAG: hypothetical protein BECKLPF1236B_GA0070989_111716 [Candidatus Kentron sp. LPFa]